MALTVVCVCVCVYVVRTSGPDLDTFAHCNTDVHQYMSEVLFFFSPHTLGSDFIFSIWNVVWLGPAILVSSYSAAGYVWRSSSLTCVCVCERARLCVCVCVGWALLRTLYPLLNMFHTFFGFVFVLVFTITSRDIVLVVLSPPASAVA